MERYEAGEFSDFDFSRVKAGRPRQGADGLSSEMYRQSPFVVNSWRAAQVLAIRKTGYQPVFLFWDTVLHPSHSLRAFTGTLRPWKAWRTGFCEGIRDGCLSCCAEKGYGFPWTTPAAGMEKPWTARGQVSDLTHMLPTPFPHPPQSSGLPTEPHSEPPASDAETLLPLSSIQIEIGKARKKEEGLTAREEGHVAETCGRHAWVTGRRGQG